jgi:hypothetical protein
MIGATSRAKTTLAALSAPGSAKVSGSDAKKPIATTKLVISRLDRRKTEVNQKREMRNEIAIITKRSVADDVFTLNPRHADFLAWHRTGKWAGS